MHGTLARHSEDLREIKERLGIMEMQYACLSRRLDRIEKRIDRIDTGLGLVES
jgi:prefoldin subunit 5